MPKRAVIISVGLAALCGSPGARAQDLNPLHLSPQHVTVSVADIDRETEWFEQVLGFRELGRMESDPELKLRQMGIPGYRVDLLWQKGSSRPSATEIPAQGWVHVVFKTARVDEDEQILLTKGTDVKAFKAGDAGTKRLIVHDPEGNEIEILDQSLDNTQ